MQNEEFNYILERQLSSIEHVLGAKASEYATEDRLHNFKQAAHLQGVTMRQALVGMMSKHTVSIYDMCMSDESFTEDVWDEKITDHLNYLILLKAVITEEKGAMDQPFTLDMDVPTASSTMQMQTAQEIIQEMSR